MEDKVLIVKTDRMKQRLKFKIRKRMSNGFSPNEYEKVVNPRDPNDLAILFEDLEIIIGCPIEKAFVKYKEAKSGGFIF